MTDADKFLDIYKQIEDSLEDKYRYSRRHYSSIVIEFLKDVESEPVRERLEICREIRNVLTHNANYKGQPIVQPSPQILTAITEVLEFVRRPPLALSYATKAEHIMKTNRTQKVLRVMEVMEKNGFSHVPILQDGVFSGVFSVGTVFMYILKSGRNILRDTTIADMVNHLPVQDHYENYKFLPSTASYLQARKHFERPAGRNKRISVIFITENGKANERLLGMLTPWDVMKE